MRKKTTESYAVSSQGATGRTKQSLEASSWQTSCMAPLLGAEIIDECARSPTIHLPDDLNFIYERQKETNRSKWLTVEDFRQKIADKTKQWDRILAHGVPDLDFLKDVPNHPCENIYVEFARHIQTHCFSDLPNCKDLRVFAIRWSDFTEPFVRLSLTPVLKRMPKLTDFVTFSEVGTGLAVKTQLDILRAVPSLAILHIFENDFFECDELVNFILERKKSLRHIDVNLRLQQPITEALAQCENIEILCITDYDAKYIDILLILSSPNLQRTGKMIKFFRCFDLECFSGIERFSALEWVHIRSLFLRDEELCTLVRLNAMHLQDVHAPWCNWITSKVLERIEACSYLSTFRAYGCNRLSHKDVVAYIKEERPNFQAIVIEPDGKKLRLTHFYAYTWI